MIHLIDRVYVEYAEAKPSRSNPLIKPEAYIRLVDRGMAGIVDLDTADKNLFNARNLADAIQHFGSSVNLVDFLMSSSNTEDTKKIIIYADEVATIQLFVSLWKSIFPNITATGAYKLYLTYRDFEFLKPKDQTDFIAFDVDSASLQKKDFFELYWGKTLAEFTPIFDVTAPFDLNLNHKAKVGAEYLMIKYMLDPNGEHALLNNKIDHFYKKNLMKEIMGLRSIATEYLYNILSEEQSVNNSVYLSQDSVLTYLQSHPKYSLLLDDKIVYSIRGYEHLKANYNLIKVATDLSQAEAIAFRKMGIEQEKKDIPCCTYIIENHKEPDLKTVLEDETTYSSNYRLFRELAKKGRYNQYLVYSFAMSIKRGTESLVEFSG